MQISNGSFCVITVGQLLVGSFTKIQLSYEKPAEDTGNIVNPQVEKSD